MSQKTYFIDLKEEISNILKNRAINENELRESLKVAFESAYSSEFGLESAPENFKVDVDLIRGTIKAFLLKRIVTSVRDDELEISIEDIRKKGLDLPIRTFYPDPLDFQKLSRIAIRKALTMLDEKISEYEKHNLYAKAAEMEGNNVYGEIYKAIRDTAWVEVGKIEGILRKSERIFGESRKQRLKSGVRAYVYSVAKDRSGRPQLLLSRTHPEFLRLLMEENIPEVSEGVIEIKRVVRKPGHRAKVAVHSYSESVEPLGACIGPGGRRIQSVIKELSQEKIDVVKWDERPRHFIANSMRPVNVDFSNVRLLNYLTLEDRDEAGNTKRKAIVIVSVDEKNKAIGSEGENVSLATRITGWSIDIWDTASFDSLPEKELQESAFQFPTWLLEALAKNNVNLVKDLFTFSETDLEKMEGVGELGSQILVTFLHDLGLIEESGEEEA